MSSNTSYWAIYTNLVSEVWPYRFWLVSSFVLALCASGAEAGFALLIQPLVDQGVVARDLQWLTWMPLLLSGMILCRGICYFFSQYLVSKVARSVVLDLRNKLFKHSISLDYLQHKKLKSGEVTATMIYTVEQLASTVSSCFLTIIGEGCLVIALLATMFYINWQLSSILILSTPIIAYFVQLTSKKIRHVSQNTLNNMQTITHHVGQVFQGQKIIRVHQANQYEIEKFGQLLEDNKKLELKGVVANACGSLFVQFAIVLPFCLALLLLTYLPNITVGSFVTVIVALLRVLQPLKRLTNVNAEIQKGLVAAQRIYDTLELPTENGNINGQNAQHNDLVFNSVSFNYDTSPAVHSLNFRIKSGSSIGIVGRSGSGKSTIVALILKLLKPTQGQISLGEQPIDAFSLASYRSLFSYVTQDTVLFTGTISENIAYGVKDIDRKRIETVAKIACIDDFIESLSNGYETEIVDGNELSGGQKQRIAIARALYRETPSIIIFDEATSGLDIATEKKVIDQLQNPLFSHHTKIIIAHRLKAVEACDTIYVVDSGKLIESDTHQRLINNQGAYAQLYQLQYADAITNA